MYVEKVMILEREDLLTGNYDPSKSLWDQVKRTPAIMAAETDMHMIVYGGRVFAHRSGPVGEIASVQKAA